MYQEQNTYSSKFSIKPRLVKYQVNKKPVGLGSRIVRQNIEVIHHTQNDTIMETCKSLSRPQTQSSVKIKTQQSQRSQQQSIKHTQQSEEYPIEQISQQYQFIDEIPLDHPIWKFILPDQATINIPKLIAENPDYFHHQLGFCACYKCECGNCRCNFAKNIKFNLQSPHSTVYSKDYLLKFNTHNNMAPLYQNFYDTTFTDKKTIDLQTQQRYAFKNCTSPIMQESVRPKSQEHRGDFIGSSSYKTFFKNWGPPDTMHFKRPHHISVSDDIPFQSQTLYHDSFIGTKTTKPTESLKTVTELTPLPCGQMFTAKSQNQIAYQPFKIVQMPNLKKEYKRDISKGPRYESQFKSLSNMDFTPKTLKHCPAKDYVKQFQLHLQQK